jgi:hypothetical protein
MPLPLLSCCISGLGPEGLRHDRTIPVLSPSTTWGWPLRLLRRNSAYENLPCKAQRQKCCLYKTPHYVTAPVRETGDVITHLQEPEFIFSSWVTHFSRDLSCYSTGSYVPFHKEATCKSSTIKGLLYAHETLIVARRYDVPWNWLWDACHMAGIRWGSRCEGFCSKEGPHYRFEQSTRNPTINLIHEFGNPLGIPYPNCTA